DSSVTTVTTGTVVATRRSRTVIEARRPPPRPGPGRAGLSPEPDRVEGEDPAVVERAVGVALDLVAHHLDEPRVGGPDRGRVLDELPGDLPVERHPLRVVERPVRVGEQAVP